MRVPDSSSRMRATRLPSRRDLLSVVKIPVAGMTRSFLRKIYSRREINIILGGESKEIYTLLPCVVSVDGMEKKGEEGFGIGFYGCGTGIGRISFSNWAIGASSSIFFLLVEFYFRFQIFVL